jgi:hypothetical protein
MARWVCSCGASRRRPRKDILDESTISNTDRHGGRAAPGDAGDGTLALTGTSVVAVLALAAAFVLAGSGLRRLGPAVARVRWR